MADDPILRLLPEDKPVAFLSLPEDEQRWRARAFLMLWVVTGHVVYSWWAALEHEPDWVAYLKELVASTTDADLTQHVTNVSQEIAAAKAAPVQ